MLNFLFSSLYHRKKFLWRLSHWSPIT
jgi:hypothetical protein